jgi:hypothetical protein
MSGPEMESAPRRETGSAQEINDRDPCKVPEVIPGEASAGDQNCLLSGRTDDAVTFLECWCPGGPWVLTSIIPDGGKTETDTFWVDDMARMRAWIDKRQGVQNIYFTVNRTFRAMKVKPKKLHIRAAHALHVDVDPRVGEDPAEEKERAISILRGYNPKPTVIIDSGGGAQAFWLLDNADLPGEPEDETRHHAVEDRNLKIEADLQADACHNIDRIMRLPGTVNVPGAKKRAKGRVPALARVVEADWARRYRMDAFTPAPRGVAPAGAPVVGRCVAAGRVELPFDLPTVLVADLPVSDHTKMLVVQGIDPDNPNEDRSKVVWRVVCEMVRAECADGTIAATILDPDNKISGHVLDQPRPVPYARRQIERARDQAIDPNLREMNDQFTVLGNESGKCRVLEFRREPTGVRGKTRLVPSLQSFEDIRNRFMNRKVKVATDKEGKDVMMTLGKWWLEHANRRQFHSLAFEPMEGAHIGEGPTAQLNLWQGFSVRPVKGDWSRMRAHITEVLAGGSAASAEYILRWMAWTLQNPDQRAEVAITFRGEPGTGKGLFGREMAGLFGQHGLHTGGSELLTGRFNLHFRDCCLLFADEVIWDGDKKAEAKVKTFLTEPTLAIEGKGKDLTSCPNMLHVIISSNSEWVVPAGPYERRYAVFDVADTYRQKEAYFAPLYAELDNGGREAMLHDMLAMDLGDWHPRRNVPKTDALNDQKSRGLGPVDAAVLDMLREAALPVSRGDRRGTDARPFLATGDFAEYVQRQTRGVVTWNAVSKALGKIGAEKARNQRPSGWILPVLGDARAKWNEQPDLPAQKWDDATDWAEGDPF